MCVNVHLPLCNYFLLCAFMFNIYIYTYIHIQERIRCVLQQLHAWQVANRLLCVRLRRLCVRCSPHVEKAGRTCQLCHMQAYVLILLCACTSLTKMLPQYLQNFHWQSDGWMSTRSAKAYEYTTETLFSGVQVSMSLAKSTKAGEYVRYICCWECA